MYRDTSSLSKRFKAHPNDRVPINRVKRKALENFHRGLNGPSIWIASPKSLLHLEQPRHTLALMQLTTFGAQIKKLIFSEKFHRIKFGTNEPIVVETTRLFNPRTSGNCRPPQNSPTAWFKTRAFDPLEKTHHPDHDDFLSPCQEMLAQFILQEIPSLQPNRSCFVLVSDAVMEGLLDESGLVEDESGRRHYVYDLILQFRRDARNGFECTGAYI